jgi:hypothetical protein
MDRRAVAGYAASWTTEGTSGVKTVTEAKWLACTDPDKMLKFLYGKASDRKLRLFSVGCIRRGWHLIDDPNLRHGVEAIERFVDGCARDRDRSKARTTGNRVAHANTSGETNPQNMLGWELWTTATKTINLEIAIDLGTSAAAAFGYAVVEGRVDGPQFFSATETERGQQQAVLRDIIGNPFRPITLDPAWLTWHDGLLVSMARQMYDSRDFADMPVMADALEEAGCTDADILGHCRSVGEHVRGCWVVDALLGKQ